jgi:hypothetical protein
MFNTKETSRLTRTKLKWRVNQKFIQVTCKKSNVIVLLCNILCYAFVDWLVVPSQMVNTLGNFVQHCVHCRVWHCFENSTLQWTRLICL